MRDHERVLWRDLGIRRQQQVADVQRELHRRAAVRRRAVQHAVHRVAEDEAAQLQQQRLAVADGQCRHERRVGIAEAALQQRVGARARQQAGVARIEHEGLVVVAQRTQRQLAQRRIALAPQPAWQHRTGG